RRRGWGSAPDGRGRRDGRAGFRRWRKASLPPGREVVGTGGRLGGGRCLRAKLREQGVCGRSNRPPPGLPPAPTAPLPGGRNPPPEQGQGSAGQARRSPAKERRPPCR